MPISYVIKRLVRSWQLYIALFIGIVLASTFFAGINVGADTAAKQAMDQALANVPVDFYTSASQTLSSQNITNIVNAIQEVENVEKAEAISRVYVNALLPDQTGTSYCRLTGISQNSEVYKGWTNSPTSIEENQTYILAGSSLSKLFEQGDIVQVNMSMPYYTYESQEMTNVSFLLNLTVAGFAELDSRSLAIVQAQYYSYYVSPILGFGGPIIYQTPSYVEDLLIVDWEKTLAKYLDIPYGYNRPYFSTDVLTYINRNAVISVWDLSGSLQRLEALRSNIENKISLSGFALSVSSMLQYTLMAAQLMVSLMRLVFIGVSLPVFFVAWYMGSTVSDVSFNLRRREIGLLLTKGFSKGQLFRMFLIEALLLGLVAGVLGIGLSLALNPVFISAVGGQYSGTPTIGIDTAIMTVAFSAVVVVLAVFRPARRASDLSTVDALREYMYVEEVKPYKMRGPWAAFILGTYKMIILALGINLINEVTKLATSGASFLLILIAAMWASFDYGILTPIGPVLFFWGFTKLFIRGSLKFQELTARAAKFLGDLGVLATRNVQRNPARAAAMAFLIALIIGYGVQITGTLASDQDYRTRVVYATMGADIRIDLAPVNVSAITDLIKTLHANVSNIESTTVEYSFYGTSSYGGLQLIAVNTTEWLNTAYYEESWFSGNNINTAFQELWANNNTIILDRDVADRNNLPLNQPMQVTFGWERYMGERASVSLTIVGFFGVRRPDTIIFGQAGLYFSQSYVSQKLFLDLGQAVANSSTARILVKLPSGTDGGKIAEQIRTLVPRTATVYSVFEQLEQQQENPISAGTLNVQRLGVAFGILAASVGVALVTFVSLKERQREASMMSVRGLSYKQLVVMLLTENLAVVTFAVMLGVAAGLIIVFGNTVSSSLSVPSLVSRRLVLPLDATLTILIYCVLVFASSILPVLFMSRRFVSRLERVVRQA